MKILLIMNPGLPVPPKFYGGIERIVYMLAEEYHKIGHEVTLLAGPDSYCSGTTIPFGVNSKKGNWQKLKEIGFVWKYLTSNHQNFDLIQNFGRLIYFFPILNKPVRKIMSYQRPVSPKGIKRVSLLSNKHLIYTGCSNYCVSTGNVAGKWRTIYNAVDFSTYQVDPIFADDAPLMFLGRLEKIKGVHTAIEVAKASGDKLIIGGNISKDATSYSYFKKEIEPHLNNEVVYLGALNDTEKNFYLRRSKALLFPIEWDEPFGITMIEAMACGTPVIGFKRGSVPEVVENGVTGYAVDNTAEMVEKISQLKNINRTKCANTAEKKFNIGIIAKQYLDLFNEDNEAVN